VRLEAGDAVRSHQGIVPGAGGKLQAIAGGELDRGVGREPEPDRATHDHDHLVVPVFVCRVALARSVRPPGRLEPLVPKPASEIVGRGHDRYAVTDTPISEPIR